MSDVDTLVAEGLGEEPDSPVDPDTEPDKQLWVCPFDKIDGDGICGASFGTKVQLNGHTMSVHKITWDGSKKVNPGGRKAKDEPAVPPKGTKKTPEAKAAQRATGHPGPTITNDNRAAIYAQSLASIGLIGHLAAGRWFDNYDLDVWSSGAPAIANGLDAVGAQNPGVRKACDLLLAGGTGGAYIQLIMACAMVGVPIAAHHGALPPATGQRFAAMIGVMGAPTVEPPGPGAPMPAQPPGPEAPPRTNRLPIEEWTLDDWREVLFAAQTNATAATAVMEVMQQAGVDPTVVTIPDMPGTTPFNIGEEHDRGSTGANGGATGPQPVSTETT